LGAASETDQRDTVVDGETRTTWGAIATLVAIQMLFTYTPVMQKPFQSRPLSLDAWIAIIAAAG
jgi:magnesium-transporting ATPase (P-type)